MEFRSMICKITASVLFVAAGIIYVVMSGQDNGAIRLGVRSEYDAGTVNNSAKDDNNAYTAYTEKKSTVGETGNGLPDSPDSTAENGTKETLNSSAGTASQDGLIDINSADLELLTTLPGIGDVKAEAIIAYRNENGAFSVPEELMLVPGIKEGTFEKLKDRIICEGE